LEQHSVGTHAVRQLERGGSTTTVFGIPREHFHCGLFVGLPRQYGCQIVNRETCLTLLSWVTRS
jgi:hypothetical protein